MKTIALSLMLTLCVISGFSQFSSFKSSSDVVNFPGNTEPLSQKTLWAIRPQATAISTIFDLSDKEIVFEGLTCLGGGVSLGKYTRYADETYCHLSFNLSLVGEIDVVDPSYLSLGGFFTISMFNNFVALGIGYLGDQAFLDGHAAVSLGLTLSL